MYRLASITDRALTTLQSQRHRRLRGSARFPVAGRPHSAIGTRASLIIGALLTAILPGCTLCQNIKRSVLSEPTRYCASADRWRSIRTYRGWADEVYTRMFGCGGEVHYSDAFEAGFKDGFADYVYGGGSGEPPPVAPREFWDVRYRTPEGDARAADWFDGYRHGARVARDEGFRERALAPTSKLLLDPVEYRYELSHQGEMPIPAVAPEPPKVESVPLGPIEPGAQSPTAPSEEPEVELPSPTEQPPLLQPPSIERAPMPTAEQELQEADPLPAAPIETEEINPDRSTPENQRPAEEIDEIFGPPIDLRSTKAGPPRKQISPKPIPRTVDREQARAAFASAVQRNRAAQQAFKRLPTRNPTEDAPRQPIAKRRLEPTAQPPSSIRGSQVEIQQTSANLSAPTQSISRADDRSAEMFRRLSESTQ